METKKTIKHFDDAYLASFIDHTLSAVDRDAVTEHLLECDDCRKVVMESLKDKQETPKKKKTNMLLQVIVPLAMAASVAFIVVIPFSEQNDLSSYSKSIVVEEESWFESAKTWIEEQIDKIFNKDD